MPRGTPSHFANGTLTVPNYSIQVRVHMYIREPIAVAANNSLVAPRPSFLVSVSKFSCIHGPILDLGLRNNRLVCTSIAIMEAIDLNQNVAGLFWKTLQPRLSWVCLCTLGIVILRIFLILVVRLSQSTAECA